MTKEILLPNSKYININLGLKYLNGNRKLYLKVLNSFSTRYKNLDFMLLNEQELKSTIHSIKGLSATLGMERLNDVAKEVYKLKTKEPLSEFSKILSLTIADLNP